MIHRSLVTDSATAPPVTTWCPTARAASRAGPTVPGYAAWPWRSVWVKSGYQRRIHHLLNRGETRNSLARDVFHGHRGQLRKHYQVGQENQLDTARHHAQHPCAVADRLHSGRPRPPRHQRAPPRPRPHRPTPRSGTPPSTSKADTTPPSDHPTQDCAPSAPTPETQPGGPFRILYQSSSQAGSYDPV